VVNHWIRCINQKGLIGFNEEAQWVSVSECGLPK
jgi:hypothetical protein